MAANDQRLSTCMAAETVGTFLLVFFGCGAVHCAVLTDGLTGLWQVGVVWGIAIMLAIYTIGGVSGAHINPAITVALATWNLFPRSRVAGYVVAQLAGAFLAAAALYAVFQPFLLQKERDKAVARGTPGSVVTAMCYGEYFPNPGPLASGSERFDPSKLRESLRHVTLGGAFLAEFIGTAILAFVVVAITDADNRTHPDKLSPAFIGLTVAALICVIAPLTQACFNPARDFGPRFFAYFAGWRAVAFPGPNGYACIAVYLLAPVSGAVAGAAVYQRLFRPVGAAETAAGTNTVHLPSETVQEKQA
jgi:glycerol uptake facilitator protein